MTKFLILHELVISAFLDDRAFKFYTELQTNEYNNIGWPPSGRSQSRSCNQMCRLNLQPFDVLNFCSQRSLALCSRDSIVTKSHTSIQQHFGTRCLTGFTSTSARQCVLFNS